MRVGAVLTVGVGVGFAQSAAGLLSTLDAFARCKAATRAATAGVSSPSSCSAGRVKLFTEQFDEATDLDPIAVEVSNLLHVGRW